MVSDSDVVKKFSQIQTSANSRGIEFNLSIKRVRFLLKQKRCYFTKVEFSEESGSSNSRSFDRLDNSKGYTDKNTVACTIEMNLKKGGLSIQNIETFYKGIKHLL